MPRQQSKIARQNKFLPREFPVPDACFDHVHVDIVGPLVTSKGYNYGLIMMDRYTRWSQARQMVDMTTESCARAFYEVWITRYGAPTLITTDQGEQFEAQLFEALCHLTSTDHVRNTAYHSQSDGYLAFPPLHESCQHVLW